MNYSTEDYSTEDETTGMYHDEDTLKADEATLGIHSRPLGSYRLSGISAQDFESKLSGVIGQGAAENISRTPIFLEYVFSGVSAVVLHKKGSDVVIIQAQERDNEAVRKILGDLEVGLVEKDNVQ